MSTELVAIHTMDESNLGLLFIGDVFFTEKDSVFFFKKVKNELKDYVVLANLEGSIDFSMGSHTRKAVRLALPVFKKEDIPENLFFSMVNNHVTDFGEANFKKNLEYFGDRAVVSTRSNVSNYISGNKIILMADKKEQCVLNGTDFISFSNSPPRLLLSMAELSIAGIRRLTKGRLPEKLSNMGRRWLSSITVIWLDIMNTGMVI